MAQQYKLGKKATSVYKGGNYIVVRLYSTPIVKFNNSHIILNSGGWMTATTKTRMNQAANQFGLGYNVGQSKGLWYVSTPHGTYAFEDNMQIKR